MPWTLKSTDYLITVNDQHFVKKMQKSAHSSIQLGCEIRVVEGDLFLCNHDIDSAIIVNDAIVDKNRLLKLSSQDLIYIENQLFIVEKIIASSSVLEASMAASLFSLFVYLFNIWGSGAVPRGLPLDLSFVFIAVPLLSVLLVGTVCVLKNFSLQLDPKHIFAFTAAYFIASSMLSATLFSAVNSFTDFKENCQDAQTKIVCEQAFDPIKCGNVINQRPNALAAIAPLSQRKIQQRLMTFRNQNLALAEWVKSGPRRPASVLPQPIDSM